MAVANGNEWLQDGGVARLTDVSGLHKDEATLGFHDCCMASVVLVHFLMQQAWSSRRQMAVQTPPQLGGRKATEADPHEGHSAAGQSRDSVSVMLPMVSCPLGDRGLEGDLRSPYRRA